MQKDLNFINRQLAEEFGRMAGKRLFISGGAGFLGYYLVQSVLHFNDANPLDRKIELIVCDNYIRGLPAWLEPLAKRPDCKLLKHDITSPLPEEVGPIHYAIHAASIASPTFYRKHPIETMDANVNGLRLLLEKCQKQQEAGNSIEGLLFFSTSEIYGDPPPDQIPTAETYRGNVSCTGPRACYDESKRYGETLCVNFAHQYTIPVTIVRPFNNYGPGLRLSDRRIIPDLARDLLAGRDLILLSNGTPTRTFCYVADAVVGYYKTLVRGRPGEAYNIGTTTPDVSMSQLAEMLVELAREQFGYSGRVVYQRSCETDYLTDNPQRRCPSIEKAKSELGFNPQISLREGLSRTLDWYRNHKDGKQTG